MFFQTAGIDIGDSKLIGHVEKLILVVVCFFDFNDIDLMLDCDIYGTTRCVP